MSKNYNEAEVRKFLQNQHDPLSQSQKLRSYTKAINTQLFDMDLHETHEVNVIPDKSVRPAAFIPDPIIQKNSVLIL